MTWGFAEIIKPEALKALMDYQRDTYGTKLDQPVFLWNPGVSKTVKYPSPDEINKEIRKPPVKQRRVV